MVDDSKRLEWELRKKDLTFVTTIALAALGMMEHYAWKTGRDLLSQRMAHCQQEVKQAFDELKQVSR